MSSWSEISQKNLFPFSKEQTDFEAALKEWAHTGVLVDHLFPIETCQLCEHSNLRYHFEIVNNETQAALQVGSSCIEKFGIAVYDEEGNELQGGARGKQLKEKMFGNGFIDDGYFLFKLIGGQNWVAEGGQF